MRARPARDGAGSLHIPYRTFFTVMPAFDAAGGACTANRCETRDLPGLEGGATTVETPRLPALRVKGGGQDCANAQSILETGREMAPAMKRLSLRIEEGFVTEIMCLRRRLAAAHGAHGRDDRFTFR